MDELIASTFMQAAADWLCDGYHVTSRYLARENGFSIIDASIHAYPRPALEVDDFEVSTGTIIAGQRSIKSARRSLVLQILESAASGSIKAGRHVLKLPGDRLSFYSEISSRERWFAELHLQVSGQSEPPQPVTQLVLEDAALRRAARPYDGLSDVCSSIGLSDTRATGQPCRLLLRVGPPIDIDLTRTKLVDDKLSLYLLAHKKVALSKVHVAVRTSPGTPDTGRRQVADSLRWSTRRDGLREGISAILAPSSDGALVLLSLGKLTVRRQWFVDPVKSANRRLVAVQLFDRELKQIRAAVLEPADQARFERGVGALLFLWGFYASVQLETDAPDIIVATASGTIVLVECTIRVADINAKVGKLVDRKQTVLQAFEAGRGMPQVDAVLISSQSRTQVALDDRTLASHGIILICKEQLVSAFDQIRFPTDPDELLENARRAMANQRSRGLT